jgi:hypothetical protein
MTNLQEILALQSTGSVVSSTPNRGSSAARGVRATTDKEN